MLKKKLIKLIFPLKIEKLLKKPITSISGNHNTSKETTREQLGLRRLGLGSWKELKEPPPPLCCIISCPHLPN